MVDFVEMEVILALMVVKIVDVMRDMMVDMMVIMEMVPGDRRRDSPGGVDYVEQRRGERPVRASQRGAGRLHRGGQEPHQHREKAVEEVKAEEGDDPEDDGGVAQPDEEVVLHSRGGCGHHRGRQRPLGRCV